MKFSNARLVIAGVAVFTAISSSRAQTSDVLVPLSSKTTMVPLHDFRPDLDAVDGPFDCSPAETFGPNVASFSAVAPSRADQRVSIVLMIDTLGNLVRYAERRGTAINPDTRGMTPAQVGAAVQAAALASRSTLISVDIGANRGSASNRGGNRPSVTAEANADDIMHSDILGRPIERAARVLELCTPLKRRAR